MKRADRLLLFLLSGIMFGCSALQAIDIAVPSLKAEPTKLAVTTPTQPVFSPWGLGEGEGFNLQINFLADPNIACVGQTPYHRFGGSSFVPYQNFGDDHKAYPYALSCLDRDGWHVYDYDAFDNPDDPSNTFYHQSPPTWIFRCPDGRIYLEAFDEMYLDKDGTLFKVADTAPFGSGGFSCTAGFWYSSGYSVYRFDGKVTTQYDAREFSGHLSSISIPVAPDGSLWAAMSHSIATFDGTTWRVFEAGKGFKGDPRGLVVDAEGVVWVFSALGLFAYDGVQWITIPLPEGDIKFITLDNENKAWIAVDGGDSGYAFYKVDRQTSNWAQKIDGEVFGGLQCVRKIKALQFDWRGRLWVATCDGLYVYDGSRWTAYHTYTSGLYSNDAVFLYVLGDGPQLPAPVTKEPGSIHGRLMNPDASTDTTLQAELCPQVDLSTYFLGASPCAREPFHPLTPLEADGSFVFTDVPVGKYFLMVQADEKNWMKIGMLDVKPGEVIDVGEFAYQPDSK